MTTLFVGLSTLDIQYFVDVFPESNIKVKTEEPKLLVGGPATNAAIVNSFLGGKSVLLSGVGNGSFKSLFVNDFDNFSVKHIDFIEGQNQIPVLASVITSKTNGDRNIFTYNPSSSGAKIDAIKIFNEIQPDQLLIDGFYPEIAIPLCELAKKKNVPIVFDGGSWKPHLEGVLRFVDYAICSANFHPPGCSSKNDVIEFLKKINIQKIAITNGSKEIVYCKKSIINEIEVPSVSAVDTLGAGDFFHGAFCFFNVKGDSFKYSLQKASVVAAKSCEYSGTREWLMKLNRETFLS